MFNHIVLYRVKEPVAENIQEIKRRFLEMPAQIKEIKEIVVGIDVLKTERSCDISLAIKFKSKNDFFKYRDHPFHQLVAGYISTVRTESYSIDFSD